MYLYIAALITSIQAIVDQVAAVAEQAMGVLTWREPRITFAAMVILMTGSVGLFFTQFILEFVYWVLSFYGGAAAEASQNAATSGVNSKARY